MFDLTKDERRVILFLVLVYLAGLGINFAEKQLLPRTTLAYLTQDLGKVNLNTADKRLLVGIPGIGETLSQRIIELRQLRGGFKEIEELTDVKGISQSKFDKIKDSLTVK